MKRQKKRQWTYYEFVRILWNNGYQLERTNRHKVYSNGFNSIAVPRTKQNPMLFNRLIRENQLVT